jgi:NhaA family Na+:H+ antiporter
MQQGLLSKKQIAHIDNLEDLTTKFQSPLQHLEHQLHNWVAYLIIPIFAFANAGVAISNTQNLDTSLIYAIITALFLGNSVGITSMILIAKKLKIINIPNEIKKRHIIGVSFLAGVGFTMSIFICSLAYAGQPDVIDAGKIGIIIGSALSGLSGYLILRYSHKLPGRL